MVTKTLRDHRTDAGLSQAQLGEKCRIHQGQIGRYERGDTVPSMRTAKRIADALGIAIDAISFEQPAAT